MKPSPKLPRLVQTEATVRAIQLVAGAIAIGLIFWQLQFSTQSICCGDFDGYYHIKWSRLLWESMRQRSFPPVFTWLPLTTLNPGGYVDHHFLFHVFQIPFTWFGDLRLGAKVSSALFATLAVLSCYWLLYRYRIRYLPVWLIALLACSAPFLFRLNMAKAPPFAIIYLIFGIHLFFTRKYWPLLPLSFVFALTYDMFVLLILGAVIWTVVVAWTEQRLEWRPIAMVLLGSAAGFGINPYFPQNLQLFYEHLRIKITLADFSTPVGQEWYPYNSWEFLANSFVAFIAMVTGFIAFDPAERRRNHYPLFFLIFSTALLILTARSQRIVEYWPPFAILFSAFSLQPWLSGARSVFTRLPDDVLDELRPFLDREEHVEAGPLDERQRLIRTIGAWITVVLLGTLLFFNFRTTAADIGKSAPPDFYKAGSEWMRKNVPAPGLVFNTDWDDFPRLFYYDPTHNYVSGLDPAYLFDKNPGLSRLYARITLGEEEDPGPLIRDRFGSRFVFSDNEHEKFSANALDSGWFDVVYEDQDCTILRIRDQKAEAPPDEPEPSGDDEIPTPENNRR